MGLWKFGYRLDGDRDYLELAPIRALGTSRAALLHQVAAAAPLRSGTALNTTVLAAYRYVQAHYDPTRTNLVGIFTDGRNQDAPEAIDLASLQAQLAAIADPAKPIGFLFFGYGDANVSAMQQTVAANGGFGGVWQISQPGQIIGAFLEASGATASFAG